MALDNVRFYCYSTVLNLMTFMSLSFQSTTQCLASAMHFSLRVRSGSLLAWRLVVKACIRRRQAWRTTMLASWTFGATRFVWLAIVKACIWRCKVGWFPTKFGVMLLVSLSARSTSLWITSRLSNVGVLLFKGTDFLLDGTMTTVTLSLELDSTLTCVSLLLYP